jgi:NAD(P)-dependent dehydrogenase (short-subunit alcohol dehydrogenase family)
MELGLENKLIVVTGAASGIGKAIFMSLLKEGAHPIGLDIKHYKGSYLSEVWSGDGGEYHQIDITDNLALEKLFSDVSHLNGLVNNAELMGGDSRYGGRTPEAWDKVIGNNAKAAYNLIELLAPKMNKGSSIVNIGSTALDVGEKGTVLYTVAKGALKAMTLVYAIQLAPNTRVNMVSPGNVSSEQNIKFYEENPKMAEKIHSKELIGRSATPEEVANIVAFLLSPVTGAVTGENYVMSSGLGKSLFETVETE